MIRIVLMRPEHDLNVGSVVRAMKNFGLFELVVVAPKCKLGHEAKKYAKHSQEILENARVVQTAKEAIEGCDFVAGTSGVNNRFRRSQFKNCLSARELASRMDFKTKNAILFGSEGLGLLEEDVALCDVVATIPTSKEHQILNLSHAACVVFYELFQASQVHSPYKLPPKKKREILEKKFDNLLSSLPQIKDEKKVSLAFKRMVERAMIADDEIQTIFSAFTSMEKVLEKQKKIQGEK